MDFFTLQFEAATSLFVGQLNQGGLENVIVAPPSKRKDERNCYRSTKLFRIIVDAGTLEHMAVRELISKASDEFNEIIEGASISTAEFTRLDVLKGVQPLNGGTQIEYGFLVDFSFPEVKTIQGY